MNDSIISTTIGSVISAALTIINWGELGEVLLFAFLGGIVGYLGKVLIKQLLKLLKLL